MTTVSFYQVTALQAFQAWADPNLALVEDEVLYPPGLDARRRTSAPGRRWTRARSTPPTWY